MVFKRALFALMSVIWVYIKIKGNATFANWVFLFLRVKLENFGSKEVIHKWRHKYFQLHGPLLNTLYFVLWQVVRKPYGLSKIMILFSNLLGLLLKANCPTQYWGGCHLTLSQLGIFHFHLTGITNAQTSLFLWPLNTPANRYQDPSIEKHFPRSHRI